MVYTCLCWTVMFNNSLWWLATTCVLYIHVFISIWLCSFRCFSYCCTTHSYLLLFLAWFVRLLLHPSGFRVMCQCSLVPMWDSVVHWQLCWYPRFGVVLSVRLSSLLSLIGSRDAGLILYLEKSFTFVWLIVFVTLTRVAFAFYQTLSCLWQELPLSEWHYSILPSPLILVPLRLSDPTNDSDLVVYQSMILLLLPFMFFCSAMQVH